jgi:hypothetical protein
MQKPAEDPHYSAQPIRPQDREGGRLSPAASEGKAPFHTHLFVLAQSSRTLFAPIERIVIARGVFTSLKDLPRKLMRYIQAYSAAAKPFAWKYSDVNRRFHTNELNATAH